MPSFCADASSGHGSARGSNPPPAASGCLSSPGSCAGAKRPLDNRSRCGSGCSWPGLLFDSNGGPASATSRRVFERSRFLGVAKAQGNAESSLAASIDNVHRLLGQRLRHCDMPRTLPSATLADEPSSQIRDPIPTATTQECKSRRPSATKASWKRKRTENKRLGERLQRITQ